jgi:uncharacterized protein YdeI (YjbR/CyaY-like superfamily)
MGKKNPEVDRYIASADEFAQPILKRLRTAFHKGCPNIEETIKWGIPTFEFHGIVGSIAAFKKHVSVGFWKSKEMKDSAKILARRAASMCNAKFESLKDVPKTEVLAAYVTQAANLNEAAANKPAKKKAPRKVAVPRMPAILKTALSKAKKAESHFKKLSPGDKRDYIEWIVEAKRDETKERRVAQAVDWLKEGKSRNWKYQSKSKR